VLFDQAATRLIQYPENRAGASYAIPEGVTSIADTAFAFCFNLNAVTVPRSVNSLEDLAFYDCADLAGVFFEGNPPALGNDGFTLDQGATVYYRAGTTGWSTQFGGRPTGLWNPQVQGQAGIHYGQFGFTIAGAANLPIVVEATTNLAGGPWTAVQNATLTNGSFYFGDPASGAYPSRYYRISPP